MSAVLQSEALVPAKAEQRHLANLPQLTGRSPGASLRFVLRDGFDAVEEDVREPLQGKAEGDAGQVIPHEQVWLRCGRSLATVAPGMQKRPLEWVFRAQAAIQVTRWYRQRQNVPR